MGKQRELTREALPAGADTAGGEYGLRSSAGDLLRAAQRNPATKPLAYSALQFTERPAALWRCGIHGCNRM